MTGKVVTVSYFGLAKAAWACCLRGSPGVPAPQPPSHSLLQVFDELLVAPQPARLGRPPQLVAAVVAPSLSQDISPVGQRTHLVPQSCAFVAIDAGNDLSRRLGTRTLERRQVRATQARCRIDAGNDLSRRLGTRTLERRQVRATQARCRKTSALHISPVGQRTHLVPQSCTFVAIDAGNDLSRRLRTRTLERRQVRATQASPWADGDDT